MAIIDESYFIGKITLPTDNTNYTNKLDVFIEDVQAVYLKQILGYELYKLFIAELPVPTSARFTNILTGAEFERYDNGLDDKWTGLKNDELKSFLAYFTYVDYTEDSVSSSSGNGVTNNEFENSIQISPIHKQVTAWNLGAEHYNLLYDFLEANESTYPEWDKNYIEKLEKANVLNL